MLFTSSGYHGPKPVEYFFVDGGCLRSILEDFAAMYFDDHPVDLDFRRFTHSYTKTFYYDAPPAKKPGDTDADYAAKADAMDELKEKLERVNGLHVYLGTSHVRRKRIEQKQVDMMIAIDMLTHTFRDNMHKATLLTADADFIPLVDALVQHGMYVSLVYGDTKHCRTSKELVSAADARRRLSIVDIYNSCTDAFKNSFKIPVEVWGTITEETTIVAEWEDPAHGLVRWLTIAGDHIVAIAGKNNNGYFNQVRFSDRGKLILYMKEQYQMDVPGSLF